MLTTRAVRSAHIHRPLIHFLGKRKWPSSPEPSHPHPHAPPEFQKSFSASHAHPEAPKGFQKSFSDVVASSSGSSSNTGEVYANFWEAPSRFWNYRYKVPESEAEIDAIASGGASLY